MTLLSEMGKKHKYIIIEIDCILISIALLMECIS